MAPNPGRFCRLVDRLGGLGLLKAVVSQGAASPLERWALRHARRCPHCQRQEAAWEALVQSLKAMDKPAAPAHLLPDLLARIADEPAPGPSRPQRGPGLQPPARAWPLDSPGFDALDRSLGLGVVTLLAGWVGVLAAGSPVLAGVIRTVQSTAWIWEVFRATLAWWRLELAQGLVERWGVLGALLGAGPPGSEAGVYLFWTGAGLLNAAALVLLATRLVRQNG